VSHTHAKDQGQRSVGLEDRVETDKQTDIGDCITYHANAVSNNNHLQNCQILRSVLPWLSAVSHTWW